MDEEIISNSEESFQDTLTKGNELIDATQNAIIDAAENVTGIFDKATSNIPPSEVPFSISPACEGSGPSLLPSR